MLEHEGLFLQHIEVHMIKFKFCITYKEHASMEGKDQI